MFESKHHKVITFGRFARRMLWFAAAACGLVAVSLMAGVAGYHWLCGFGWVDSVLNASMILAGMGPMGEIKSDAGKLFAAAYALYSGLLMILLMGVMLAPVFHRVLHMFHVDEEDLAPEHANSGNHNHHPRG